MRSLCRITPSIVESSSQKIKKPGVQRNSETTMTINPLSRSKYKILIINEPRSEKTGLRGFRPGPTQTGLYNHTRWLEA